MVELNVSRPYFEFLPYESHINSILLSNNESLIPYLKCMSSLECTVLQSYNNHSDYDYDFFMGRNLENIIEKKVIKRDRINGKTSLIKEICHCLKKGQYMYLAVDTYYITNYINSMKCHIIHCPMISGLKKNNKKYFVKISDFFNYKHYGTHWTSFNELFYAFKKVSIFNSMNNVSKGWTYDIQEICPRYNSLYHSDDENYDDITSQEEDDLFTLFFNTENKINDYRKGKKKVATITGKYVYNVITYYLNHVTECIDDKALSIVYNHFRVFDLLYRYQNISSNEVKNSINSGLNISSNLLLLGLKFNLTKDRSILDMMSKNVAKLAQIDAFL